MTKSQHDHHAEQMQAQRLSDEAMMEIEPDPGAIL